VTVGTRPSRRRDVASRSTADHRLHTRGRAARLRRHDGSGRGLAAKRKDALRAGGSTLEHALAPGTTNQEALVTSDGEASGQSAEWIPVKLHRLATAQIGAVAAAFGAWALWRKARAVARYYTETGGPVGTWQREQKPAATPIWREPLVAAEWLQLRMSPLYLGHGVRRGDGAAVVVVPGFLMNDWYLGELRGWLARIGYRPFRSDIGWNAECLDVLAERLLRTIEDTYTDTGGKVHLIGHSLGGVLARSVAARRPERTASVTTLASPFRGLHSHPLLLAIADHLRRAVHERYPRRAELRCFTPNCGCHTVAALQAPIPGSVPQLAIYTRTDGIVDWRFCMSEDAAVNVEVEGTHVGLAFNADVYRAIAARLGQSAAPKRSGERSGPGSAASDASPPVG
jgi:triacylglycerol lipase